MKATYLTRYKNYDFKPLFLKIFQKYINRFNF